MAMISIDDPVLVKLPKLLSANGQIEGQINAFANPSNPKYDEAKAKEAYGMAIEYLKKKLL